MVGVAVGVGVVDGVDVGVARKMTPVTTLAAASGGMVLQVAVSKPARSSIA